MAYVEEGITQSHPLPRDILRVYDWDNLIEPLDCVDGLEPLAWEHSPSDLAALSPANLPEDAVCSGGVPRTETTDIQDQAVPARRKQESNAQAQRKSRQKKKVRFM